ncbi:MAG TPA: DUF1559 domain-containing protein [Pirellulales bacterium]
MIAEIFVPVALGIVVLMGGLGIPVGTPPLPADPVITRVAPEECLWYFSWYGTAKPDQKSDNQTEQLLAEEEVQQFVSQVVESLSQALRKGAATEQTQILGGESPKLLKILLTRPGAVYLSRVNLQGAQPELRGGLIVNTGDQTKEARASLEKLLSILPPQSDAPAESAIGGITFRRIPLPAGVPQVSWGFKDDYLLVGFGAGGVEELVARLVPDAAEASWLKDLHARVPVARPGQVSYANVAGLIKQVGPLAESPQAQLILRAIGLSNVRSVGSVTGMDEKALASKTWIAFHGDPTGLMASIAGKPLAAADLSGIPRDATFAMALRLDPVIVYQRVVESASRANPLAAVLAQQVLSEIQSTTNINVINEIFKPLGDVWTVYNAPSAGGALLAGSAFTVRIRDRAAAGKTHEKLLGMVRPSMMQQSRSEGKKPDEIHNFDFKGQKVYYLQFGNATPFAPAWCLTDDTLIIAFYPQTIKSYLSRKPSDGSLADVPAVASLLAAEPAPNFISYEDTTALLDLAYPVVQLLAPLASTELYRMGIEIETTALPSMSALRPHLTPSHSVWRRTSEGVVMERRQSLPMIGVSLDSVAPIGAALLWPAIGAARGSAQLAQSSNNMKQIALAFHTFHDANSSFPAAYTADKDGKRLLSWRVTLLQYIDKKLYDEFHQDEPWDSEHNKKLIERMPTVFKNPSLDGEAYAGKTTYLVPTGAGTMFVGAKAPGLQEITDGTSNTIMLVEADAERAVPWTKPDDLEIDPKQLFAGLEKLRPEGFLACLADGSVRTIRRSLDAEMLRRLFDPKDGMPTSF